MKKHIKTFLVSFILILSLSCEKIDVHKETPHCIKKKIEEQKDKYLVKVTEYKYNGKVVYLFEPGNCPDALYYLYDCDCNTICSPAGGISGQGNGLCPDFYQNATYVKLIWSKN